MTVAELKRRLVPGVQVRKVQALRGGCDELKVVVERAGGGFWLVGEKIPNGDRSFVDWPKAANLKGDDDGFEIAMGAGPPLRFLWVEGKPPTAKDRAVDLYLNRIEHMSRTEALDALAADIGFSPAVAISTAWWALQPPERIALEQPCVCDARLREWLTKIVPGWPVPEAVKV